MLFQSDKLINALVVLFLISFCAWVLFLQPQWACQSQAKLMKMPSSWGFVQGCMIEVKPGQWVPLKNYRVL
jgi:hypothetical protein